MRYIYFNIKVVEYIRQEKEVFVNYIFNNIFEFKVDKIL